MEGRRAITPRAAAAWILEAPAAAWALALVALAFGLWSGLGDRYLHDEGLLTWHFAQVTLEAPAAALFWQKSRPLLAALYGPFAGLGQPVFTVIHVVIAALALPLLAGVARAIGQRSPNLPALLVASSALWLACGPAGVSNSDALTGLCLALYLWLARGRPLAAGLLLGALLFARSEVAVFAGGIGLYALLRGPRRLALAIPALPAIYALLGALYHHDLLPAIGLFNFDSSPRYLLPALPFAALAIGPVIDGWREGGAGERATTLALAIALALGLAAYLAAIRGLPAIGLFNFDSSPRYLLPALPSPPGDRPGDRRLARGRRGRAGDHPRPGERPRARPRRRPPRRLAAAAGRRRRPRGRGRARPRRPPAGAAIILSSGQRWPCRRSSRRPGCPSPAATLASRPAPPGSPGAPSSPGAR
ncbi:MAG: hypothetical protein H6710_24000 [Myxococcales bacterium]|nr:hypothetical protein [Myxococcales bacterium]